MSPCIVFRDTASSRGRTSRNRISHPNEDEEDKEGVWYLLLVEAEIVGRVVMTGLWLRADAVESAECGVDDG